MNCTVTDNIITFVVKEQKKKSVQSQINQKIHNTFLTFVDL